MTDDSLLTTQVQEKDLLWDKKHDQYKNIFETEEAWEDIAKKLDKKSRYIGILAVSTSYFARIISSNSAIQVY